MKILAVILRGIATILRWVTGVWVLLVFATIAQWILVHIGFYAAESKWIALGFFPPIWFNIFLILPFFLFLILRPRKWCTWMLLVYIGFVFGFGDFAFRKAPSYQFPKGSKTQNANVVALNVRYYSYGFDKVINASNQMDADIYLLSENDITEEQVTALRQKITPKTFYMGKREGTAIISKHPILSFKEVEFPTHQASLYDPNVIEKQALNPHRSFAHAVIDLNGVPIHAISVRFLAGRPADRTVEEAFRWGFYLLGAQLQEVNAFVKYISKLEGPIIFGGDLNATPSSIILQTLSEVATDLYLLDHYWGGFTFLSEPPSYARLDYIFAKNQVELVRTQMLPIIVSDHLPVFAEFRIPAAAK